MTTHPGIADPAARHPTTLALLAGIVALLSASCCLLPIGLSVVGLGGAWLAMLGPVVTYRPYVLIAVALILGWVWLRLLRSGRPRPLAVFSAVVASASLGAAVAAPMWEGAATRLLWDLWTGTA